jgi:hypothetical protein
MAIINKTGISNGGTIQAEHVTRVIDALSGVSTDTLILSGSMTGSLTGILTGTASLSTTAATASKLTVAVADTTATTFYPLFVDISSGGTAQGNTDVNFTYNPQTNTLGPSGTAAFTFQGTASLATTASFAISSSRAVSSSFAATASYALNADSSGEYVTLNFIHTARTGTTTGTKTAFGTFPVGVNSESRIAAVTPFNCIIVSASLSTHCSTPGSNAKVGYDLVWYNGATNVSQSFGFVDLVDFIPTTVGEHRQYVGASMDAGRNIYIKMTDGTTDASVVYSSHMAVLLKKV